MTTIVVDAAPAPVSELSVLAPPTTEGGSSEAMILCCVLAEHAVARLCATVEDTSDRLHALVRRVLMHDSHAEILEWRGRVPESERHRRWDNGRRLAAQFWPTVPGVRDLPDLDALGWYTPTIPTQPR
jgi:hypothetical protein